jgi:NAD(P)-dependent dehydrogenase (short-subunit alcohol dehydrogenase family)
MQIEGSKAVVIGGASGMGRATAELLASRGAKVAILDRPESDGKAIAESIGASFFPSNVTDYEGTEKALADAVADLGGLNVCVTTAGGGIAKKVIGKEGVHDLESFRKCLDLNIVATFNITRLAAAHMNNEEPNEDGERGVIINTASIAGLEGQIGQVAYGAAKAAIIGMCLPAARDLGPNGIRVTAIAPSLFATGALQGMPDEMAVQLTKDNAFPKRMGRPDEYAKLACQIVENAMINGQCLRLDAGVRFAPR